MIFGKFLRAGITLSHCRSDNLQHLLELSKNHRFGSGRGSIGPTALACREELDRFLESRQESRHWQI